LIGEGPIKIGCDPGFGTFFLVERGFEGPMKIPAYQVVKQWFGIKIVSPTKKMKPF
jgi:hypothetical protein